MRVCLHCVCVCVCVWTIFDVHETMQVCVCVCVFVCVNSCLYSCVFVCVYQLLLPRSPARSLGFTIRGGGRDFMYVTVI